MKKVLLIAITVLTLLGCGDKTQYKLYEIITPSDHVFTYEDLEKIGFKKSKEYNIYGLEGATLAWYGFWATDKNRKEYELRFYPSHSIAVSSGALLAQEVTGKDGKIKESEVTWKEGVKERRQITDSGNTEDSNWNKVVPKYGNYAIYGNIVMLCEGPEIISLEVCWKLISALEELE
jgi:hypothetical protein